MVWVTEAAAGQGATVRVRPLMARTVTGVPAGMGGVLGECGLPDFAADFDPTEQLNSIIAKSSFVATAFHLVRKSFVEDGGNWDDRHLEVLGGLSPSCQVMSRRFRRLYFDGRVLSACRLNPITVVPRAKRRTNLR